jgi:signal transduction histidine kinase
MSLENVRVLLIEDNEDHASLIQRRLRGTRGAGIKLEHVRSLTDGIQRLASEKFAAVLLDLNLPDSPLSQTLPTILADFPSLPVVVLTSLDDIEAATNAVHQGAQDYLVKGDLDSEELVRSIRYAIERKRGQAELEQYAAALERSNQELQQFARVVAHDVKQPLNNISLFCRFLDKKYGPQFDEETTKLLSQTSDTVQQMARLIDGLLQYARVDSGPKKFAPVDVQAAFEVAKASLRGPILRCEATVTCDPLPTVQGETAQIVQLFRSLIDNSLRHSAVAAPKVHVTVERRGDLCEFRLTDNGQGIPADDLDRVFEMFQRLSRSTQASGSGIGLAVCRRIVARHGGRIHAESKDGQGTTIVFSLPSAQ